MCGRALPPQHTHREAAEELAQGPQPGGLKQSPSLSSPRGRPAEQSDVAMACAAAAEEACPGEEPAEHTPANRRMYSKNVRTTAPMTAAQRPQCRYYIGLKWADSGSRLDGKWEQGPLPMLLRPPPCGDIGKGVCQQSER